MNEVNLKIAVLRKARNIGQRELADQLGVSYQTVSKWETGINMPDISLLPSIASYFGVTVDELLGLRRLPFEGYIPSEAGTKSYWGDRYDYLFRTRKTFWNDDYMEFLVSRVWGLTNPVDVIDFGCGLGYLGQKLLPLLPEGSSYTGVDINEALLEKAKESFAGTAYQTRFILSAIQDFKPDRQYGMAVCQAFLRHLDRPEHALARMAESVAPGGLVACIEVNRELESDGLYVDGVDYAQLCARNGFRRLWKNELEKQSRDYALGIRLPVLMSRLGLERVDIRANDKVQWITPEQPDYPRELEDFLLANGLTEEPTPEKREQTIDLLITKGLNRREADSHVRKNELLARHFKRRGDTAALIKYYGLMVVYGWKR